MSGKPKIALMTYAIDGRPAKGTALYARKLVERLLKYSEYEWYLVHYEKCDDPIYSLGAHEIVMPKTWYSSRFLRQLYFFWLYRKERFDIIHWFQPRLYPFFWFAPAHHLIVTMHGAGDITAPTSFSNLSRWMFTRVLRYRNNCLDRLIAVSEYAKKEIVEHYRASTERVSVTYNGGGEDFTRLSKKDAQERMLKKYAIDGPYILDISRHVPHKNIPTVIQAYIQLRNSHAERKEKVVIVGSASYGHGQTYTLARNSQYASDIQFREYVEQEDLNALYCASELLVFPSLNEGFGLPVIEAFASGVPVITSNTTALPEVAGDAACTIDPMDSDGIAEAMYHVLSDTEYREELVAKGIARAQKFSWDRTASETLSIYKEVLHSFHS